MNKEKEIIKYLKDQKESSEEYLKEWLDNDEEAQEHYPTIEDYDNVVAGLGSEMFYIRIYDLAIYNLSRHLLNKLKK